VAGFVKSQGVICQWGGYMIYCCGVFRPPFKTVFLLPDFNYRDRKLEILHCPVCGAVSAVLTQFNIKTNEYEVFRPKRKQTLKYINEVESGKWQEIQVEHGTKGNAGFVYGVNKEYKDGEIHQYSVDFNGNSKLTKIINNSGWVYGKKKEKYR